MLYCLVPVTTISDHPSPPNQGCKMARFSLRATSTLIWGGGGRGVSVPCYSVRDCRCIKELGNCKILSKLVLVQLSMALQTTQGLKRNRNNSSNNCTTILFFQRGPQSLYHILSTPLPHLPKRYHQVFTLIYR